MKCRRVFGGQLTTGNRTPRDVPSRVCEFDSAQIDTKLVSSNDCNGINFINQTLTTLQTTPSKPPRTSSRPKQTHSQDATSTHPPPNSIPVQRHLDNSLPIRFLQLPLLLHLSNPPDIQTNLISTRPRTRINTHISARSKHAREILRDQDSRVGSIEEKCGDK